ncbi:MAG: UDP-N-acetylglucosamine 1-carboxyvinyltransferase [bacterium]
MNGCIKVIGGNKLQGTVIPIPNKNSIVAALPACILSDNTITYKNVPNSTDVQKILEMLQLLGAEVDDKDYNNLKINCKNVNSYKIDSVLGNQIRASILFVGPLLARFGKAKVPLPGGCVLGKRSIATHIDAFKQMDVDVVIRDNYACFTVPKKLKKRYSVWQCEASVTSTENVVMYASGISSDITLTDAASEPHVGDLMLLLKSMGAGISGIGSNCLRILGNTNLKGTTFIPRPDFVDISGYIVAAAITGGKIRVKDSNVPDIMDGIISWFKKFNVAISKSGNDILIEGSSRLSTENLDDSFPLASENLPKFVPRPWPGFPVDVLPIVATLACKSKGRILLQNWMYENGLEFVTNLNDMGANIFICDPQRVIISGPVKFKGGEISSPGVIQACMAIFLASLTDPATTTIYGINILKRRYPNLFEVYKSLGANIQVLESC